VRSNNMNDRKRSLLSFFYDDETIFIVISTQEHKTEPAEYFKVALSLPRAIEG
jgi:hypothetical protein